MSEIIKVPLKKVKPNPNNPRTISKSKYQQLLKSLTDFPEMLDKRPIVVVTEGENYIALGGNMRLKALTELKVKKVPVMVADDWSEEKRKEFIIKDNIGYGDWDFEVLKNLWDDTELVEWGLDLPEEKKDDLYTRKIKSPCYEPGEFKPQLSQLVDNSKTIKLLQEIDNSNLPEDEKEFLRIAASRHVVFDYGMIADYYARSSKEMQMLMENSALVIIDFKQAIEQGFVKLSMEISDQFDEEYGEG